MDERLVVSPKRARYLLDVGNTRLYELLAANELDSFLDGRSRKITVESIRRYVSRRLSTYLGQERRSLSDSEASHSSFQIRRTPR